MKIIDALDALAPHFNDDVPHKHAGVVCGATLFNVCDHHSARALHSVQTYGRSRYIEHLVAANEEALSSNEELQSTNEELETAKEELQSTNEELVTVNEQLQNRNSELGLLNDDLTNLLSSVNIPILMLSGDWRIRRFTPQAEKLLNLLPWRCGAAHRPCAAEHRDPGFD